MSKTTKEITDFTLSEFDKKWSNHQYVKETLMEIHESEWKVLDNIIDYCGG